MARANKVKLPRRAVGLVVGALASLCLFFVLGRPWALAEHDRYRTALHQLRVRSSELEQDIVRLRLGLEVRHGPPSTQFTFLREQAQALGGLPSAVAEEDRATLESLRQGYMRALDEDERQLRRFEAASQRAGELREALTRRTFWLLARLPARERPLRAALEALLASVLSGPRASEARDESRVASALADLALVRPASAEPLRGELGELEASTRKLLTWRREAAEALQLLLNAPASIEADRLTRSYLQLYEGAWRRAERFRITLFGVSLLLVLYVGVVLVRLARAHAALRTLNQGLEDRVAERTAALSASHAELAGSEARKAAILEASPDCILLLDERGRVLELNPAAERTFGLPRPLAVGCDVRALVLSPDAPAPWREALERALSPSEARPPRQELTVRRGSGALFPAELTVARVRDGGPPRLTVFLRDMTERKEVERLKNEFVSTVSHELRTPLTSIRGSLGLLEGGIMGPLPEPALDMVRIARSNTERLIRLINDILDLEKIEAGKLELRVEVLEPGELVEATLKGLQAMADGAQVRLRARASGVAPLRADRDRLTQVLTNLVSNAIKFSPPGGEVEVRAEAEGHAVRFSVRDQGPGISAEQRPRLFGKFQQLDSSDTRSKGGTGLGLAISQAIVEQHGGRIEVDSAPGQGATFTFRLVRAGPARPSLTPPPPLAPQGAGRPEEGVGHDVLVVTAEAELAGMLGGLLAREGYRMRLVGTLADAQTQVAALPPDVVVVDGQLPDGAALELVRLLRQEPRTHGLPVVVVAGRSPAESAAGLPLRVDWMDKPLDEARLLEVLREATRRPGQPRVLVVDDDAATRTVLCTRLADLGVQCLQAADGESALALARLTPPDLIVLDVGLPRLDGFAVVEVLRQGRGRATPLIVFTGRELSRADRRQLTLGITRHLTKARSSEDELVASVRELLNGLLGRREGEPEARKALP